ncbi:MAG: hypothetical protein EOP43_07480 [Sphingobacteriaceae bacterium]|nr:MAG: hypothetical protein EOP43_07480 [Sphingobacteriaceae bacterium]
MQPVIVYPENKEQLNAIKAVMKAMKIGFEQQSTIYPNKVLDGVAESLKQADAEQLLPYTNVQNMLNS